MVNKLTRHDKEELNRQYIITRTYISMVKRGEVKTVKESNNALIRGEMFSNVFNNLQKRGFKE